MIDLLDFYDEDGIPVTPVIPGSSQSQMVLAAGSNQQENQSTQRNIFPQVTESLLRMGQHQSQQLQSVSVMPNPDAVPFEQCPSASRDSLVGLATVVDPHRSNKLCDMRDVLQQNPSSNCSLPDHHQNAQDFQPSIYETNNQIMLNASTADNITQGNPSQCFQRMSSADARIEDFLNNLPDFDTGREKITDQDVKYLPENDPQAEELNRILEELEEKPSQRLFDASSKQSGLSTEHQMLATTGTDKSDNANKEIKPSPANSTKLHPTITKILLHGIDDASELYGPIEPLKEKTRQTGVNVSKEYGMSSLTSLPDSNGSLKQPSPYHTLPDKSPSPSTTSSSPASRNNKVFNTVLQNLDFVQSPDSSSEVSCGKMPLIHSRSPLVSSPESMQSPSDVDTSPSLSMENAKSKYAISSKLNREKKKIYVKTIEEKLADFEVQNDKLQAQNVALLKENSMLKQENSYLKTMFSHQLVTNKVKPKSDNIQSELLSVSESVGPNFAKRPFGDAQGGSSAKKHQLNEQMESSVLASLCGLDSYNKS